MAYLAKMVSLISRFFYEEEEEEEPPPPPPPPPSPPPPPPSPCFLFIEREPPYAPWGPLKGRAILSANSSHELPPELTPPLSVAGCQNGVLCFSTYRTADDIYLWNPTLRHLKKLPPAPAAAYSSVGFGHDPLTGDLKVVRVSGPRNGVFTRQSRAHVFSLASGSWTAPASPLPPLLPAGGIELTNPGAYPATVMHGRIHFGVLYTTADPATFPSGPAVHSFGIVAFDLNTERLSLISPPVGRGRVVPHLADYVGQLLGRLSIICNDCNMITTGIVRIWAMVEYGVVDSWALCFTLDLTVLRPNPRLPELFIPFAFADDKYLLVAGGSDGGVFFYHVPTGAVHFFFPNDRIGGLVAHYVATQYPLL